MGIQVIEVGMTHEKALQLCHDALHFITDAYMQIRKEKYKEAKETLAKASSYIQKEMIKEGLYDAG